MKCHHIVDLPIKDNDCRIEISFYFLFLFDQGRLVSTLLDGLVKRKVFSFLLYSLFTLLYFTFLSCNYFETTDKKEVLGTTADEAFKGQS